MAVAIAASGCGDDPDRGRDLRDPADEPPRVLGHGASTVAANSLRATVHVSLSRPARVFVEYGNPLAGRFRSAPSAAAAEHAIPLVRLRAKTEYQYSIGVGDSAAGLVGGSFETGALPPRLDAVRVEAGGRSTQPLLLADLQIEDLGTGWQGGWFLVWDEVGEIVWYHEAVPPAGAPAGTWEVKTSAITRLPNGNFIYIHRHCCLVEITPLGETLDTIMFGEAVGRPHHEILIQGDGRLLYPSLEWLDLETGLGGAKARTPTHAIRLLDRSTNATEIVWRAEDRWNEHMPEEDVTNVNSVSIGPRGNYLVSARVRNAVVSLTADFQTVEWQLGGRDGDFAFPDPNDRFYFQHTAQELDNGNVLLFDNGDGRPQSEGGLYSRALELRLDHDAKQATKVWEHRADRLYSPYISSAFRLRNGNTLVNYGVQGGESTMAPVVLVEVSPAENEAFRVELARTSTVAYHRYRAYGDFASIKGEAMLRPPAATQDSDPWQDRARAALSPRSATEGGSAGDADSD